MHKQVDRIYELKEYLRFHARSLRKLIKLKNTMTSKSDEDDSGPIWDEMDNAVEDLDQVDYYMESLKERFNNLIELVGVSKNNLLCIQSAYHYQEFNIENATQSDQARYLSIIAALYLPISYVAVSSAPLSELSRCILTAAQSVFGITTMNAPAIIYLYIAIPLLFLSLAFTLVFPWAVRRFQKHYYAFERKHIRLPRRNFTMLGDELPDSADVPHTVNQGAKGPAEPGIENHPSHHSLPQTNSRPRVSFALSNVESDRPRHRNDEHS